MNLLLATVNRLQAAPFVWGERDCILTVADWVHLVRGVDPAADLRLTYATAGECQRVTGFFTDPVGVVAPRMSKAGLAVTAMPVRGDVGLLMQVTGPTQARPHGAICLGQGFWAVKSEAGVTAYRPDKIIMAWSVGYQDA